MSRIAAALPRRIVSALTACAVALAPAPSLGQSYFFRNVTSAPVADSFPTPPAVGNFQAGSGAVAVQAPTQVRARLGLSFQIALLSPTAVTWAPVGGPLPPGIGIDGNGVISGAPTAVGTYNGIVFQVTDAQGQTGRTQPMTIDTRPLPQVSLSFAGGTLAAGQNTNIFPTVKEVYGSQSWSIVGALPGGMTINPATGVISGYPEVPGNFSFAARIVDGDGAVGSSPTVALTVTSTLAASGYRPLQMARLNKPFTSDTPTPSGNRGSVNWTISPGSAPLPTGLSINNVTGVISGMPTTPANDAQIVVRATDQSTATAGATFVLRALGTPSVSTASTSYGARIGKPLSIVPTATNVIGTPSWSQLGALPTGITQKADGSLQGTPTAVGSVPGVQLKVLDLYDGSTAVSPPITLSVYAPLALTAASVPAATIGQPYQVFPPQVSGARGTVSWAVTGALPSGLALDPADNAIRGTPKAAGTSGSLAFVATDSYDGSTATSAPFTVTVGPAGALAVAPVPATIPATVTQSFSYQPQASGGTGPYQWGITGALPGWLAFDITTGRLSGYPDAPALASGLQLTATDASGTVARSQPFSIVVAPVNPFTLASQDSSAQAGASFRGAAPSAQNNVGSIAYILAPGSKPLPDRTSVDPATGSVVGTPTVLGEYPGLVVQGTDASGAVALSPAFKVTVVPAVGTANAPTASMNPAPSGLVFQTFGATPSSSGFGSGLTWTLAAGSGSLPPWATLTAATGAITGQPQATGTWPGLILQATDSSGKSARTNSFTVSVTSTISLAVSQGPVGATVGTYLVATPSVAGAQGKTTWSVTSGTLPAGLSLNAGNGAIYGTPTQAGTSPNVILTVRDGLDNTASTAPFTVTVLPVPLTVTLPSLLSTSQNGSYSGAFSSNGGTGAVTWSALTSLPPGLRLDAGTGVLSGTPTQVGQFANLVVQATDSTGATGASNPFTITVTPPSTPVAFSVGTLPSVQAQYGVLYTGPTPSVTGAKGPLTWTTATGTLPGWLRQDPVSGALSGTPDSLAGGTGISFTVSDGKSQATTSAISVSVSRQSLSASLTGSAPNGRVGDPYAASIVKASNAVGAVTWTATGLPDGLAVNGSTGQITGTPTTAGSFGGITLTATDATNTVASATSFAIQVVPAAAFLNVQPTYYGRAGVAFAQALTTQGLIGAQTWKIATGTKPAWSTFSASTGTFTGTPNVTATSGAITLSVTDSTGRTITSPQFTISTSGALSVASTSTSWIARVGVAFTGTSTKSGNTGTLQWSLGQGSLPATLTVDQASGSVVGTPTDVGSYQVTLRARDTDGTVAETAPFTISVFAQPTATAQDLTVRVNAPLSFTPTAANTRGTVTWTSTGTALPGWLALTASSGKLSGTPTATGATSGYRLTAKDGDGATGQTAAFGVTVIPGIAISGIQATPYVVRLGEPMVPFSPVVSNTLATPTWALASGSLPPGINYVAGDNSFSGTPTSLGTYSAVFRATDPGDGAVAAVTVPITVVADLAVTGTPGVRTHVGQDFVSPALGVNNTRTGGTLTWSLNSGTFPSWVTSFDPATGVFKGNPPQGAQTVTGLVLKVTDSTDNTFALSPSFSIQVLGDMQVTGMATSYTGQYGVAFSAAPPTTVNAGTVTWSWPAGSAAPSWAVVDPATGRIYGVPNAVATTPNLQLKGTDDYGATALSVPFSLIVQSLPTAQVRQTQWKQRVGDTNVSVVPNTIGVAGTQSWQLNVTSGTMPDGFGFDPATGIVHADTANAAGTVTYTLTLTDSLGAATSTTQPVTITVSPPMTMSGLAASYVGHVGAYMTTDQPQAGGAQQLYFTLSSPVPGLTLDPTTGVLKGQPTLARAQFPLTISAVDAFDGRSASQTTNLTVTNLGAISGTYNFSVPAGSDAGASTFTPVLSYSSGTGPVTWSLATGTLPTGASVDPATGRIVGIVTSPNGSVRSGLSLRATDADGSVAPTSATFAITVVAPMAVSSVPAQNWRVGTPASVKLTVTSPGTNALPTWSADPATLPPGVQVAPNGFLSGTPTQAGTYQVAITAANPGGGQATRTVLVTVRNALTISYATPFTANVGDSVSYGPTTQFADGTVSYSATEVRGTLPTGVTFVPSTGTYQGTVQSASVFGATIRATDSIDGATATTRLTIDSTATLTLGTITARNGRVGTAYTWPGPDVGGASGPVTWTIASGSLPTGMSLASDGGLTGSPTAAGTYSYVVQAAAGGLTKTASGSVTVRPTLAIPAIANQVLQANTYYGESGLYSYAAFGGATGVVGTGTLSMIAPGNEGAFVTSMYRSGYYYWSCYSGYCYQVWQPTDNADPTNLMVQGTYLPQTMSGLVLQVTDSADGAVAYSNPFTLTFVSVQGPGSQYLRTGVPYTGPAPLVQGFNGPITWSTNVTPPGLSLNASTGVFQGVPTTAGTWTVTLSAAANGNTWALSYTFFVKAPMAFPAVNDISLVAGTAYGNGNVNQFFGPVTGFNGTPSFSSNKAPAGTSFGQGNLSAGYVQAIGTPTAGQTVQGIVLTAVDQYDGSAAQSAPFTAYVLSVAPPPNSNLRVNQDFTGTAPTFAGFPGPVNWAAANLPPGMKVDPLTGVVSGKPTTVGTYSITLTATSGTATRAVPYTISVKAGMTMAAQPDVTVSTALTYGSGGSLAATASVSNSLGNVSYAMPTTGGLRAGAQLYNGNNNYAAGMLIGKPTAGIYPNNVITATDPWDGSSVSSNPFTIYAVSIGAIANQVGRVGTAGASPQPVPTGFPGTVTWSVDSGMPPGMTVDSNTGILSGIPTQNGTYTVVLRATSGTATLTTQFTYTIYTTLSFANITDVTVVANTSYGTAVRPLNQPVNGNQGTVTFTATASPAMPYSIGTYGGNYAYLSGTSPVATYQNVVLTAKDTTDGTTVQSNPFNIYVVQVTPPPAQKLRVGTQATIPAPGKTGFPGPVTWSYASGSYVPDGMTLQADGSITGTPLTAYANQTITLQAQSGTATLTTSFPITVSPKLVYPTQPDITLVVGSTNQGITALTGAVNTLGYTTAPSLAPYALLVNTGTQPRITGTSNATLTIPGVVATATDPYDGVSVSSNPFTVYVVDVQVPATQKLRVGNAYSGPAPSAPGFPTGVTWTSSFLPDGLRLDPATGIVSGTPTTPGDVVVTLTATSGTATQSRTYTISVKAPLAWNGTVADVSLRGDISDSATLQSVGGVVGTVGYAVSPSVAPLSLTQSTSGTTSTPKLTGQLGLGNTLSGVVLTITDQWDGTTASSNPFSVYSVNVTYPATVYGRVGTPLAMTAPVAQGFPASTPATYQVTGSVAAPAGLTLNASSGVFQGTPTATGTFAVQVKATAGSATVTRTANLVISPALTVTAAGSSPFVLRKDNAAAFQVASYAGLVGASSVAASPSVAPYAITATAGTGGAGTLKLGGSPSSATSYPNVMLTVTDALDGVTATSAPFTVYAVDVAAGTVPTGKVGNGFAGGAATANGYPSAVQWRASASTPLQAGLMVNQSTGAIFGQPTAPGTLSVVLEAVWNGTVIAAPAVSVTVNP